MCHQRGGQQQNKALEPHEEELDSEVGDAHRPQNLPEAQEFNSRAEEDEAEGGGREREGGGLDKCCRASSQRGEARR